MFTTTGLSLIPYPLSSLEKEAIVYIHVQKCKKAKQLSEEALQIAEKREVKGKEEERYTHLNAEVRRAQKEQQGEIRKPS